MPALAFRASVALSAFALWVAPSAQGAMVLQSSAAIITQSNGLGGTMFSRGYEGLPAYTPTFYQYNTAVTGALTNGTSVSNARMGLGIVDSPGYLGIGFATGTLLTQRGNTNTAANSAAVLHCDFHASWINDSESDFGTQLMAGASFGLVGNVPVSATNTSFVQLTVVANFYLSPDVGGQITLRNPITPTPFFSRTTSGNFTFSRSDLVNTIPATIPAGYRLLVTGYIEYRVHNDVDEVSIETNRPSGLLDGDDPEAFFAPSPASSGLLALAGLSAMRRRR